MMQCAGEFIYRGMSHTDAGTFVNDKGQAINYNGSFKIKLDENTDDGVQERIVKIAEDDIILQDFSNIEVYSKITIQFEVRLIGQTNIKLVPIRVDLA